MDLIPYAVPFFLLALLLELGYGVIRGRNTYRLNDCIGSLFMGSLRTVNKLILIGVGGLVFVLIEEQAQIWRMDTGSVWTWVFAWVAYDFCYYWNHRLGHERQIFWASHVAHHQSEDYNLSTALRQTSTGFLLSWIFYIPVFLVGVPAEVYITVASANLIYQFWVHTEHVGKLGWLEWVFVTPSNHRVHHAQNDRYLDRNYGGCFIIWDRLFGTFQDELDEEPCIYGIRGPLHTFNPLWANLHIYWGMIQDAWYTKSVTDKLRVLFARTGWRPDDVVERLPRLKNQLDDFHKYDPQRQPGSSVYAVFQLICATAVLVGLLIAPSTVWLDNAVIIILLTFTMVCTARWLDGHGRALNLDTLRLLSLPAFAYWFYQAELASVWWQGVLIYLLCNAAALWRLHRVSDPVEAVAA